LVLDFAGIMFDSEGRPTTGRHFKEGIGIVVINELLQDGFITATREIALVIE